MILDNDGDAVYVETDESGNVSIVAMKRGTRQALKFSAGPASTLAVMLRTAAMEAALERHSKGKSK